MVNAEDFAKAAPGASIPTFSTQKKRALGLFRELLTDGNVTFLERMCIGDIRASMPDRRRPFRKSCLGPPCSPVFALFGSCCSPNAHQTFDTQLARIHEGFPATRFHTRPGKVTTSAPITGP